MTDRARLLLQRAVGGAMVPVAKSRITETTYEGQGWGTRLGYSSGASPMTLGGLYSSMLPGLGTKAAPEDYIYAYSVSATVYACVSTLAQACASVAFRAYRGLGDAAQEVDAGPLVETLHWVNPWMTDYDLWETTFSWLELNGNSFWALDEEEDKRAPARVSIWPMNPTRVRVVPGREQKVAGYVYRVGSEEIFLEPREVVHLQWFSPISDYCGMPPAAPAEVSTTLEAYAISHSSKFYKQGARPGGVVESDIQYTADQLDAFREQFEDLYAGSANAYKPAVLWQGMHYKSVGISPQDADVLLHQRLARENIAMAYKVPPAVIGVHEYSNYANAAAQLRMFWQNGVVPRLEKLGRAISKFYLQPVDEQMWGVFDYEDHPALQAELLDRARAYEIIVRSGIRSINEIRADEGDEEAEWGNLPPPLWWGGAEAYPGTVPEQVEEAVAELMRGEGTVERERRQMALVDAALRQVRGRVGRLETVNA